MATGHEARYWRTVGPGRRVWEESAPNRSSHHWNIPSETAVHFHSPHSEPGAAMTILISLGKKLSANRLTHLLPGTREWRSQPGNAVLSKVGV